jgi:TPR repeat protein
MASHLQDSEADALAYLGYFYEKGIGVEVDYGKAIDFYQKAVEKKSALGMWTLGSFYYSASKYLGSDVEKQKLYWNYAYKLVHASALYGYPKAIAMQCDIFTDEGVSSDARVVGEAWCNVGKKVLNDENHDEFEETPVVNGYAENISRADQVKVAKLQAEIEKVMIENKVEFLR